jgi:hypothetical protein
MDVKNVPQDESSVYEGEKKAIYATDEDGKVKVIGSSGWEAEETATLQAVEDLENKAKDAYCEVKRGEKSPLYYYMYALRMDLQLLAESTGFFKWTIKKDFDPNKFANIKDKRLEVYAEALGKTKDNLKKLEEINYDCE